MLRFAVPFLVFASLSSAQALKVAIINSQQSVLETGEIKKAQADLEAKFKPRQTQIEQIKKELGEMQSQLQAGQGKLTPQAEQDLQIRAQRRQRELQRLGEDLQQEVEAERNEILQRTGSRMQEIVRKMAEERGLDIVVDVSNTIYYKPGLELTKDATIAYDKAYPPK